jgi:phosphatidate cytidylyltransferase
MRSRCYYRSLLPLLIFRVQMNDVFAYVVGKSIGGPKLAPRTSPNKTIAGSLGAIVLTTLLIFWLSGLVFREGSLSAFLPRLVLGLMISITGQFGDLTISAIRPDVGVKDTGKWIPGHGRGARPGQQPLALGAGDVSFSQLFPGSWHRSLDPDLHR